MKMRISENRTILSGLMSLIILTFTACEENTTRPRDNSAPPVPSGLTSTTGDNVIWLEWDPIIGVSDLDGYSVYRSTDNSLFYWQADIDRDFTEFADYDVVNGVTYYYGVSSFDFDGNESDVSFDYVTVFDTPRPQGGDVVIYSFTEPGYTEFSGFDFSQEDRVPFSLGRADIFLEFDNSPGIFAYFINLGPNGANIQDMGYTQSLYDITYAPADGWSSLDYAEAIEGHTYVIRTFDNNYAMIRITDFSSSPARNMTFDWAYQAVSGNRELKIGLPSDIVANPDNAGNSN